MTDKNNAGLLFKNDKKQKNTDSDYNGTVVIEGNTYWINGWKNTSKKGDTYLSLRLKPKTVSEAREIIKKTVELSDEIPF